MGHSTGLISRFSRETTHSLRSVSSTIGHARRVWSFLFVVALLVPLLGPALSQPALAARPTATTDQEAPGEYQLYVSSVSNRGKKQELARQNVVHGNTYIFVTPEDGVDRVRFFIDPSESELEDPYLSGTPFSVDDDAPFDLAGTNPGNSKNAKPFDTKSLENGPHTIIAALDLADGTTEIVRSDIIVHNGPRKLLFKEQELVLRLPKGGRTSRAVHLVTSDGTPAEVTLSEDASWLSVERPVLSDDSNRSSAPASQVLTVDTEGLEPGTYTATLTASSSELESGSMSITAVVEESTCSPLPCNEILVALPYTLDFSDDHGKILDGAGVGTGFTHIDPPTNATGYLPSNLAVDMTGTGTFNIATTSGIAYTTTNSQDNAIGVGIDAPSQISVLSTTILNAPAGTGKYEQGGLWFGNDEDNYVKFVVISNPTGMAIQHLMEVGGQAVASKVTPVLNLSGATVALSLTANPNDRSITSTYSVNGGPTTTLAKFTAPGEFFSFDAAGIDPNIGTRSFGGPFATHRNGASPVTYSFDNFSVAAGSQPPPSTDFTFNKTTFSFPTPTALAWGPDDRLYATEIFGKVHRIALNDSKQVVSNEVFTPIGSRLTLGITVDPASTPDNVILWVAHSNDSPNNGELNSSTVTRLSGANLENRQDVITGLPRAIANHAINSIHFSPDGRLYIALGGNTGAGAPNSAATEFGTRAEQPLSASLLVADVKAAGFSGQCASPELTYDVPATCDVTVFSSGLRNMYDFIFHSNGKIYGPDNGLGVTGTFPPSPTAPCEGFGNTASWTTGGHNPGEQPDSLYLLEEGKYYGHPNQYRSQCVFKDGSYQGVAPLPNYTSPILSLGMNKSADGTVEYKSNAFNGALQGQILITNYSVGDDITRIKLSADGTSVVESKQLVGGFSNPLPLLEGPDGTLYVGELGANRIAVLVPTQPGTGDPGDQGTWLPKTAAAAALLDPGSAALNGKLYVVAGKTSSGPVKTVRVYDPVTDSWTDGPSLPPEYAAVENPAVVAYDGKLYVFGGSALPFSGAVTTAAVLDPSTSTWTILTPMNTARGGAGAQVIGDKIYVVGGLGGNGASLASMEIYNPALNSWSPGASMATRRDNPGTAVLDGKLYAFGGRTRNANGTVAPDILASVEMYDPGTNSWTSRASMPTARRTMVVGTLNGRAQVMGGERTPSGGSFAANEEYDPASNTWRTLAPMANPRHGAAAGTINGVVYVATGGVVAGSSFSTINDAFFFDAPGEDTEPPEAPAGLTAAPNSGGTVIDLDWDDNTDPDFAGYHVYRSDAADGTFTKITVDPVAGSTFSDMGAPAGATSYYYVTAVDTSDNESSPSNTASATLPDGGDTGPPVAPTGLVATGSATGISLDWADNTDPDLAGYHVYRADSASGSFNLLTVDPVSASTYEDTAAPPGMTSYYYVTAVDTSDNESAPSGTANASRPSDATNSLVYSKASNRSTPAILDGATVAGNVYIFTTPDTSEIVRVRFYLDNPSMVGTPTRTENGAPYDFAGGTVQTAKAFNTATLSEGSHSVTAAVELTGGTTKVITATFTVDNEVEEPGGNPWDVVFDIPTRIQAEDYRSGGASFGFQDTTSANLGGAYRTDAVDIQATTDTGGGYNVGWIATGEWLAYDINVTTAGNYVFTARVATINNGRSFHIEIDGVNVTGSIAVPTTGGYQTWKNVSSIPVNLTQGTHTLKIVMETPGFNLNYVDVTAAP